MSDRTSRLNVSTYDDPSAVAEYTATSGLRPTEAELVARWFPEAPAKVLDLGCGAGRTTRALVDLGYDVTAVDLSAGLLAAARTAVPEARILEMDATDLDLPSASFDAVLFSFNGIDCIHPTSARLATLREACRVLVPGGPFLWSSHNIRGLPARNVRRFGLKDGLRRTLRFAAEQRPGRDLLSGFWRYQGIGGIQVLQSGSPAVDLDAMRTAGFTPVEVRGQARVEDEASVHWDGSSASMRSITWSCPHVHYAATAGGA